MLDQIHQQFIDVVKAGRGKRLKETPELFTGLFWTGQQAVELGLADQFGNLDFVAREMVKAEDLVDYTRHENVAERLAKKFGAAMGEGAMQRAESATVSRRCADPPGVLGSPIAKTAGVSLSPAHRLLPPGADRLAAAQRVRKRQAAATARRVAGCKLLTSASQQRGIAVRRFDEQLGLPALAVPALPARGCAAPVAPHPAAGSRRRRSSGRSGRSPPAPAAARPGRPAARPRAQVMRGPHHGRARVGHGRHAGLADAVRCRAPAAPAASKAVASKPPLVVALLVHLARQFDDLLLLQRQRKRLQLADALEVGAGRLGVLADPVRQRAAAASVPAGSTSASGACTAQPKSSGAGTSRACRRAPVITAP